jgi:hypothetical protein
MQTAVNWLNEQAKTATGETVTLTVIFSWDYDENRGLAWLDGDTVGVELIGRTLTTFDAPLNLEPFEDEVISSMRVCISALDDKDTVKVRDAYNAAQELFGNLLMQWSEDFATLYNSMLDIYRAKTPRTAYSRKDRSIPFGLGSTTITTYKKEKVQPIPPTAIELVARFDALVSAYRAVKV